MSQWGSARLFAGVKIVPVIETLSVFTAAKPADKISALRAIGRPEGMSQTQLAAIFDPIEREWRGRTYADWRETLEAPPADNAGRLLASGLTRWVNFYPPCDEPHSTHPWRTTSWISRELADAHAEKGRIACIRVDFRQGDGLGKA